MHGHIDKVCLCTMKGDIPLRSRVSELAPRREAHLQNPHFPTQEQNVVLFDLQYKSRHGHSNTSMACLIAYVYAISSANQTSKMTRPYTQSKQSSPSQMGPRSFRICLVFCVVTRLQSMCALIVASTFDRTMRIYISAQSLCICLQFAFAWLANSFQL